MGSFQRRPFADAALRCDRVTHVISRTRPSRFSACNIEKLGMGLGTRLAESEIGKIEERRRERESGPHAIISPSQHEYQHFEHSSHLMSVLAVRVHFPR